jgi:NAD-dependent SIR2 family protein deacetylase
MARTPIAPPARRFPIGRGVQRLKTPQHQETAVLLGAGASSAFGIPRTSELLELIVKWIHDGDFLAALEGDPKSVGPENRQLLHAYLMQLLPGKDLRLNNLPLVTSLLSLLDYSLATGQSLMPGRSVGQTRQARALLERGILEAIQDDEDFGPAEWKKLDRFCRVLSDLKRDAPSTRLTLLTTNYDMAADIASYQCAGVRWKNGDWHLNDIVEKIDFGFRWQDPLEDDARLYERPLEPEVTLLKLHGSTNWLRCPLCDNTYIHPWGPIWHQAHKTTLDNANRCHCTKTRLQTQIISPSYVREMREPNLHSVWKTALDSLRVASRWLIIGYSFPDEDLAVRALFTRAYSSKDVRPNIVVVQNTDASVNRYEAFFDGDDLTFCTGGLDALLDTWTPVKSSRRARSGGRSRQR